MAGKRDALVRTMMACRAPCRSGDASTFSATAPVAFACRLLDRGTDLLVPLDLMNRKCDTTSARAILQFLQARGCVRLGVGEHRHSSPFGEEIEQDFLPFAIEIGRQQAHAGRVAAGTRQRAHQAGPHHVVGGGNDGNAGRGGLRGDDRRITRANNGVHLQFDQLGCDGGKPFIADGKTASVDRDILAVDEAELAQRVDENGERGQRERNQRADAIFAWCGLRDESTRPGDRRTAEQRDERAACHSITSSAVICIISGTARLSAFAVLRLIANSNFVGCITGRSAGFSPLSMRPV